MTSARTGFNNLPFHVLISRFFLLTIIVEGVELSVCLKNKKLDLKSVIAENLIPMAHRVITHRNLNLSLHLLHHRQLKGRCVVALRAFDT